MDKLGDLISRQKWLKPVEASDVADAIHYVVAQPAHVSLNEVVVRPTGQAR